MTLKPLQTSFVFSLLSTTLFLNPLAVVQANATQGELFASNVTFVPPSGDRPKDSQGGASRDGGKCPGDDKNLNPYLTAVVPPNVQRLTMQPQASLFVYIPQTTAKKAFVSLQDDKNQHHYQTFLSLNNKGGIVKISLPAEAPPLAVGTEYKWSFAIICGDKLLPDSPTVTGTIRRVNPTQNLTTQLNNWQQNPSLEQANLLGNEGLWYDMLAVLMAMKTKDPHNAQLNRIWSTVLNSGNLGDIASQPIIASK
ncbi:MAG: DUF928 domain-containing protein [Crocosphaera sp.]|nr:DUF928 domain-containing protein [Crocosphaera sp.]